MLYYTLEICPMKDDARIFYESCERSNDNAGFDLYSINDLDITINLPIPYAILFGISARLLKTTVIGDSEKVEECHYWLAPRSCIFNTGLIMANSMSVIDRTYRGELKALAWSITGDTHIRNGDRLFQIIAPDMGHIKYIKVVDSLPTTNRGAGRFGSTGK
jgi:dUTPase